MSFSNDESVLSIPAGLDSFGSTEDEDENAEFYVRARVTTPYKRKLAAMQQETGLNESEIIRQLIERAVVYTVIKRTGVLGVSNGNGRSDSANAR